MNSNSINELKSQELDNTIHREQGKLFSFINAKMPSTEDAEDVLQDVFEELVEISEDVSSIENVASWLYRVARNKITDWYRKRKPERYENKQMAQDDDESPLFLNDILSAVDSSPVDKLMQKVVMEQVAEALELLPHKQREVFVMHEFDGLSLKQIAEITDASVKTVISRKHYAVLFLREQLRDLYTELLTN